MTGVAGIVLSLVAGLSLGAFFFGGLWWTVRCLPTFRRPGLAVAGSLLVRMAVVVAGFLGVSAGHWQRLLACLVGFAVVRLASRRTIAPPAAARIDGGPA